MSYGANMTNEHALQPQTQSPSEFVPVEGGTDTTSAETLLVTAYIAMWLLFFGFMAMTHRRQRGLNDKVSSLEQALKKADAAQNSDAA